MTILSMTGVTKSICAKRILDGVELQVGAGEVVALIGLNGAGKTSLLKCAADLIALDAGRIEVMGTDHRIATARNHLAYIPDRFTPFRHLRGAEFLRYMLMLDGRRYSSTAVTAIFDELGLSEDLLGAALHTLSKGTGQRLGLAAALLADKHLYLLDEPTSGLDVLARAQFRHLLPRLRARGCGALLATHALADVAELCDRVCVIHRGRLCFDGSIEALLQSNASPALEVAFLDAVRRADPISH